MDTLSPSGERLLIGRPPPCMSDGAKRLHMLRTWLEVCHSDPRHDAEAYLTACRLREQAAALIGYMA